MCLAVLRRGSDALASTLFPRSLWGVVPFAFRFPFSPLSSSVSFPTYSLAVLSNVPDIGERRARLTSLQNQLEALVGPQLVEALSSHDQTDVRFCLTIFADMNRQSRVETYYAGCCKNRIMQLWKECADSPDRTMLQVQQ